MTDVQQAVPVAQEDWRINPDTPTVILTPNGRIAINWSVQQAGGDVTYDLAEQTAEMIVRAVNPLPCKSGEGAGELSLSVAMREINEMAVGVGDIFPNDATAIVAIGQTASASLDVFDAQIVGDAKAYVEAIAIVAADPVAALAALRTDATQTREAELPADDDELAMALCEADGHDPHEMTYHFTEPGVQEPYGDRWNHYTAQAKRLRAALNARAGA